jgi:hypothetical protein
MHRPPSRDEAAILRLGDRQRRDLREQRRFLAAVEEVRRVNEAFGAGRGYGEEVALRLHPAKMRPCALDRKQTASDTGVTRCRR